MNETNENSHYAKQLDLSGQPTQRTPICTHSWGKAIRHAANATHIHRTECGD